MKRIFLLLWLLAEQPFFYLFFHRIFPYNNKWQHCSTITVSAIQVSFGYTGIVQPYTVPDDLVGTIQVDLAGASGGSSAATGDPGYGARVICNFLVPAATQLYIFVGGIPGGYQGGWNGGGNAISGTDATGGGGASDIRIGLDTLTSRVVVAAGGGGYYFGGFSGCGQQKGGDGGFTGGTGSSSACPCGSGNSGSGASGANQILGGGVGNCNATRCACGPAPTPGFLGIGGNACNFGGGGGGGYYGGGGGGYAAGGGGGSSHCSTPHCTSPGYTPGYQHGPGYVTLTFITQPTSQPTKEPTSRPSSQPSMHPSSQPTSSPTSQPSCKPSGQPSSRPSRQPTTVPTRQPTGRPSMQPSSRPTRQPTNRPSIQPSSQPTCRPTMQPTSKPTMQPSSQPSHQPSIQPSSQPTVQPSSQPTSHPSMQPSRQPTTHPSSQPSAQPTMQPTSQPSLRPSTQPTCRPTRQPTSKPTTQPSSQPSSQPSMRPTGQPSSQPTIRPSGQPSSHPSSQPSAQPTRQPTNQPSTQPSSQPSSRPTMQPTGRPTVQPSCQPSSQPSRQPSNQPSVQPTGQPSMQPSAEPSSQPTRQPSSQPTVQPSLQPSSQPTTQPSSQPSVQPSTQPTSRPTVQPTGRPTTQPTSQPSSQPSRQPTSQPSMRPSSQPTSRPTMQPTGQPSMQPSSQPSSQPTNQPTARPTMQPSSQPSLQPTRQPTSQPSIQPSSQPTSNPTMQPTSRPSMQPSAQPSSQPTGQPTGKPSMQPSSQPSMQPTGQPSLQPSSQPSCQPTAQPSSQPSMQPTNLPSTQPSVQPSSQPTIQPSRQPSSQPSSQPSCQPTVQPTMQPSRQPSSQPSSRPSMQPTSQPSMQPSSQPTTQPTVQPTSQPTGQPSSQPSGFPTAQPTGYPTKQPSGVPTTQPSTQPSSYPTGQPTYQPTDQPTVQPSSQPTCFPSSQPSGVPSAQPSHCPSSQPSGMPSSQPTGVPTGQPTRQPSGFPSSQPTAQPSGFPSVQPTSFPSCQPTVSPTGQPSCYPTSQPSSVPSRQPTGIPSSQPTMRPSSQPTGQPSSFPSSQPTTVPSSLPSCQPTGCPSSSPSGIPSSQPSSQPTSSPTSQPSSIPSTQPTSVPSCVPSNQPSSVPSVFPSSQPTCSPTTQPSSLPSVLPSGTPTTIPTRQPSSRPTNSPSGRPSSQPTACPSTVPSLQPLANPTEQPTSVPSSQPSTQPTSFPTVCPSGQPTSEPSRRIPLLSNATFAADGWSFLVKFNLQCTTPKLNEDFVCDKFFHFPCANVSTCHWLNSMALQAVVPSNDECAVPGDNFQISDETDNPLCSCSPAKVCNKVDISLRQVAIKSAETLAAPSVIFSLPRVLPSCSGLNFDLSNSFGSLGRSWSRVNVTVVATSVGFDVSALQRTIQSHFNVKYPQLTPPLKVSSSFLKANTQMNFTATICNFLGGCNTNQFTMKVVEGFIPTATIVNPLTTIVRSQPLLLLSSIQKTACNTTLNVNDLRYIWTVFRRSKTVPGTKILGSTITSSSKDPSRFALNPYSLQSNQSYIINLLTKYLNSSSTTSVQMDIKIGNIRAIIQGNSQQAMRVGEIQNLDGSQSYDEDKENLKGFAAGLKFSWSCSASELAIDSVCSSIFNATLFQASRQSPFLMLKANQSAANRIASFSLTVLDPLTTRTSTTTITMNILPSLYPTIVLSSNSRNNINNKINPSQSLQLTANIHIPTASMNGNITWFSTGVDLRAISSTSLGQAISSNLNSMIAVYLALKPNSLPAGKSYTFGLKCQLNNNIQTTSFITVAVNAPPSLGNFGVTPSSGTAYVEIFHLLCNRWTDSDLPLYYQFSFLSNTGLTLITKTLTTVTYTESVLPEGRKENNKKVTCQADIYDNLNANSTVYSAVQVNSLVKANLSALVHFNIDVKNAVDLNDLIKGVNIASSLLNQPNCTLAPNCTKLNRFPCLSTSHTCGPCQISYFSSSIGDGNELCMEQISDRVITNQRRKVCYLNCSSHGDCIYYSQITGNRIDSCFEGDLSCYTSCSCDVGYKLSNYCEMTDEESKTWISLRDLVVDRIIANVQQQDPTEQVVSGWINSLLAVSQVPNQISEKSLASLLDLLDYAVSVVNSNSFTASTALANYLDGMDSLATVLSTLENGGSGSRIRRRLEEINSYNQQISGSLKNYSLLISQSMVPGQTPSRTMKSNFKLHIQNLPLGVEEGHSRRLSTSCFTTTEVSLPQTLLEKGLKQAPTVLTIPTCAENQPSLQVSAISLSSKLFNNDEFTSNALSLSLSSHPCSFNNTRQCNAEFSMESHNSGTGLLFATENRTVNCVANDFKNHTVLCSNHKNYSVPCLGNAEKIVFHCPTVSLLPSCQSLIGNAVNNNVHCETKSFGKENITCVCPLSPSSVSYSSSATIDVSIVALLKGVETNFVSTLLSADDWNATSLAKSWEAIVTVVVFLSTIIGFMFFSVHADRQSQNKVSMEEKMMGHAKVHSVYQQKLISQGKKDNHNHDQDIDLFKMAEEALPGLLSCPSLKQRIWNEEKKFHRWLGIIYYFSTVVPRILRVVSLASNIIIMLFIQSLTYAYTHGDDGKCQPFSTEDTCLQPRSPYGTGGSKCYWKSIDANPDVGNCEFIEPENSIEVMLFVAIFSGLMSAPLAICVDWMINNVLAAPDGSSAVSVFPNSQLTKEKSTKELAIFPSDTLVFAASTAGDERNRGLLISSSRERERHKIAAERDCRRLKHELFHYHHSITDEEHRGEVERLWALSRENQRLYWDNDNKVINLSIGRLILQKIEGLFGRSGVGSQSISKSLHQELIQLFDDLEKEIVKFTLLKTEKDQSKRLLYLFQKDLLPGINGEILQSKEKRDNIILKPISIKIKVVAWCFLGILDLGMLFYVFLFALSQDSHHQAAWGRSLGIYLFLDIVLISTLMVIFMHVLLPSLIMRDVGKIKKKVTESIKEFYEKMDQEKENEKEKQLKEREKKDDSETKHDDNNRNNSFIGKGYGDSEGQLHLSKRRRRTTKNRSKKRPEIDESSETDSIVDRKTTRAFNAAKYLFLSYRMAEQYPDLKASQIILQYSSPWPKQDYKHIKHVKRSYSVKYSGITRAISIIVVFFLTNLLATPLAIQDMILQICTTAAIGYTILIHIQLFYIYPALVIIPTLALTILVFVVKYYYQKKKNSEEDDNDEEKTRFVKENKSFGVEQNPSLASDSVLLTAPAGTAVRAAGVATTRRQSLQLGVHLATLLKDKIHEEKDGKGEEEQKENDSENELWEEYEEWDDEEEKEQFEELSDSKEQEENEKEKENVKESPSEKEQETYEEKVEKMEEVVIDGKFIEEYVAEAEKNKTADVAEHHSFDPHERDRKPVEEASEDKSDSDTLSFQLSDEESEIEDEHKDEDKELTEAEEENLDDGNCEHSDSSFSSDNHHSHRHSLHDTDDLNNSSSNNDWNGSSEEDDDTIDSVH
jgi:hypothetical protein